MAKNPIDKKICKILEDSENPMNQYEIWQKLAKVGLPVSYPTVMNHLQMLRSQRKIVYLGPFMNGNKKNQMWTSTNQM